MALTTKRFFFSEDEIKITVQINDGDVKPRSHIVITRNPSCINQESIDIILSPLQFDKLKTLFDDLIED